ncbi:MAG: galactarate dehydratase [Saprospiraceae bacterium]|nr:galactarate dehydratase [Saprospiraceae bacterium]
MIIQIHEDDNVGIVTEPAGLLAGSRIDDILVKEPIPMGHKISLADLKQGSSVIRYGAIIGYASGSIQAGSWVHTGNVAPADAPVLDDIPLTPGEITEEAPLEGYTFAGFRNRDGSVGTKNILAISSSVQCVSATLQQVVKRIKAELLPNYPYVDDVVGITHHYGCGVAIDAPAAIIPIRTLMNINRNPNFGNEVMVLGLGCEKLRPERILTEQESRDHDVLYMQDKDLHGFSEIVQAAMNKADRLLTVLNKRRRETCPASDLVVGMQCGGSDSFTGITGNPVVGKAADLIVRAGGTAFFSEVTEVRDAAHLLVPRASNRLVAEKLIHELKWYDAYLRAGGADRSANPSPGNKAGGLTNVIEKAMGSVAKSGSMPIVDVLAPGEKIEKRGLQFVATPASDFVCGTLQIAAGMNVHLFVTGRGTPYGLAPVPVIKIGTNSDLSQRWYDLIDFDAGRIITEQKELEELGWDLFRLILEVASGNTQVAADRLGLHNDLSLFNPGPLT